MSEGKETRALRTVIRRALARELTKMQEDGSPHIDGGWTGPALASWIAPGVIASVEKHIHRNKPTEPKHEAASRVRSLASEGE